MRPHPYSGVQGARFVLTIASHIPGAQEFLAGANNMDEHFKNQPYADNLPVLIGLLSVWNVSFLGYGAKAILPYCQVSAAPRVQGAAPTLQAFSPRCRAAETAQHNGTWSKRHAGSSAWFDNFGNPCSPPRPQALSKFAPHIQQVDMESNGKGVDINGVALPFETGEIDFGEGAGRGGPGRCMASTSNRAALLKWASLGNTLRWRLRYRGSVQHRSFLQRS